MDDRDDIFAQLGRLGQNSHSQEEAISLVQRPRRIDRGYDSSQYHSSQWTREDETTLDPMHLNPFGKLSDF